MFVEGWSDRASVSEDLSEIWAAFQLWSPWVNDRVDAPSSAIRWVASQFVGASASYQAMVVRILLELAALRIRMRTAAPPVSGADADGAAVD